MKKISNKPFLICCSLLLGNLFPIAAQNLDELIQIALSGNYQIRIVRNEALMSENANTIGNSGQLPTLTLNGGTAMASNNTRQEFADGSFREGNNAGNSNLNFSILANWTAFDGFAVYAQKDRLEYLEKSGKLNLQFYIEQTVADLVVAYYQMMYEKQVLENYRRAMQISLFRLQIEEKRKAIGSSTLLQYGQAHADYNSDSIAFLGQQATILSLGYELNRLINRDPEQPIVSSDLSFQFITVPHPDSLKQMMQKKNILLELQLMNELMAESQLRIEKANRYPKLNIYGGYQVAQSSAEVGFIQLNRNLGPVIGLSVSYNLFNGGKTQIAVKNAEIEHENRLLNSRQTEQELYVQLLSSYAQYKAASEQKKLATDNVEMMEKVYAAASEQFAKGTISGYDFRLTQLSLLNAQMLLLRQQLTVKILEVNLYRISGGVVSAYV